MESKQVLKIFALSLFVAWLSFVLIMCLKSTGLYTQPTTTVKFALDGWPIILFMYLLPPGLFILALQIYKKSKLSTFVYFLVPTLWLSLIFLNWAHKPWSVYGSFPWAGFMKNFVGLLPPMLILGLSFWRLSTIRTNKGVVSHEQA